MRMFRALTIVMILLLLPAYAFCQSRGYMHISLMEGDVQIKTPEAGDWGFASINGPLYEGDQVWVPQGGRVELQLNTGTFIRLDEESALQILSMDQDSSQFYLSQGHAYIYYEAPRGSVIQVDTPDASTRAFDRAVFRIDIPDQYTDVAVYKGYVETENRVGNTRINAGEMLSVGQDTNGEVAPMGSPDEWEKWNKMRNDKIFARKGESSRYLPSELAPYSYDFDSYGRWAEVSDYGRCWIPTVAAGVSWSPYRSGRWIWRGGDYVWVGYEPWGWAPYHYGRWAFVARFGWCWVPPVAGAVYWGPGYVGWVRTADYVGWVPLAPGETYYGRGNYGPHSVNIINININKVKITNVYKNVYVTNGVTVVSRNTFASGSPKMLTVSPNIVRQKIFVKNNISVAGPEVKPTKASYFTSAKPVPQAKRPPQRVKTLQVKELKQARPFVKAPDKSVLNPGEKPKPLPLKTLTTPKTPGKGKPMIERVRPGEKVGPAVPEGGPAPRGERPMVKPEKKPALPEGGPAPRGERPFVKPEKEKKPVPPEGVPTPRGEKPIVKPEKKPPLPEGGPAPRGERPFVKPEKEKKPVELEGGPAPKRERPLMKPEREKRPAEPEGGLAPRGERPMVKPEKRPAAPEGGPAPRGERPIVKPEKERKPTVVKPERETKPVEESQKGQQKKKIEQPE